jgi:hypothetical protein
MRGLRSDWAAADDAAANARDRPVDDHASANQRAAPKVPAALIRRPRLAVVG